MKTISKTTSILSVLLLLLPAMALAQACGGNCAGCGARQAAAGEHCHWLEVTGLVPDGSSAAAGVQEGDVLASYGGRTVGCLADLNAAKEAAVGESASVVLRRGDKDVTVTLPKGKLGVYLKEWQHDIAPDADAKIITGVPALNWLEGKSSSFMGALDALLQQQGLGRDYTFLSGVSGAAFRTHFFDTWCPSSPDPTCGFNASTEALGAAGLKADWLSVSSDGKNKPQIIAAIKRSIDAGMPVLAVDLISMPEWGIIVGYQKDGQELFCRTYFDKRKGYELAQKFPFAVAVLKKTRKTPGTGASMSRSFRLVVQNLTTEKCGEYFSGLAAFDRWTARLTAADIDGQDSGAFSNVVQANYWTFSRLVDDRKTGIEYLDRVASEMPRLASSLATLTALYRQEVKELEPLVAEIPCPGTATRPGLWPQEIRDRQATALQGALEIEARALPIWQELAGVK